MLGTLAVPITVMRAKSFPSSRRPFFDTQVLRNIPFVLFSMGAAFGFMGMYVPFYYISSYAQEKSITSISFSFYLLTILNASSIFGRLVPNFFADVIGPLNILTPFCALCSVVAFCWPSIESKAPIIIFCIAYGFFSGTFVSMMAPALVTLSKDLALVGTHMGMSFAFGALGLLIGNPVAGVLLSSSSWIGPAMFCGTANMVAAFCILAARISQAGRKIMVKV
jgi:predicted MFS family arabinose efflux permease